MKLQTFAYFDLFMPVIIAFGIYLHRFRPLIEFGHSRVLYYSFLLPVFLIYLATFIMAYGIYVYDWQVVKIEGIAPGKLGAQPLAEQGSLTAPTAWMHMEETPDNLINAAKAASAPLAPAMPTDDKPGLYEEITRESGPGFVDQVPYPIHPRHKPYLGVYLIGHVSESYLFLEKTNLATIGHILSADKEELPHLRFNLEETHTLRELLRRVKGFSETIQHSGLDATAKTRGVVR